jgi:nucleoside-diphosphate-sugar epimerase
MKTDAPVLTRQQQMSLIQPGPNGSMKNMMVTGGCGFIGSVFIRHLLLASDCDGRVINVDKPTYAGNFENLAGVALKLPGRYVFIQAEAVVVSLPILIPST